MRRRAPSAGENIIRHSQVFAELSGHWLTWADCRENLGFPCSGAGSRLGELEVLLSWCWVRSSKPLCRASIVGQVGSIPMRLRFRCWAFCLIGAILVCGLRGKNWSRFLIRPVDMLWVLVRIGTSNDAGWSSPVAREAHNLEVVGSNPAPAT